MSEAAPAAGLAGILVLTTRRVAVALAIAIAVWLLLLTHRRTAAASLFYRLIVHAVSATMAFALFEVWPRRLPRWCERWVLQVAAVGVAIAIATSLMYVPFTPPDAPPFPRGQRLDARDLRRNPGRALDRAGGDSPAEGSPRPP